MTADFVFLPRFDTCSSSTFIYILIKSNVHGTENEQMIPRGLLADDDEPLLQAVSLSKDCPLSMVCKIVHFLQKAKIHLEMSFQNNTSSVNAKESVLIENQDESMFDRLSPVRKRIG